MADTAAFSPSQSEKPGKQGWMKLRDQMPSSDTIRSAVRDVTVEPAVFLSAIAAVMQGVVIQQLVADRSCRISYNRSEEFCANVTDEEFNRDLKTLEANYNLYTRIIAISPYMFASLMLGAFCDRHGPKLLILVPLFGDLISCMILTTVSYFSWMGPEMTLIAHTVKGLTGSHLTCYLGIDNYIIVNSSTSTRTVRLALLEVSYLAGMPLGFLLGGQLFGNQNYTLVFLVSLIFFTLSIIYLLWRLRHVPMFRHAPDTVRQPLFSLDDFRAGINVVCRPRAGRNRMYLILTLICARLILFPLAGEHTMFYPYTQLIFKFTVKDFSYYDAYTAGMHCFGTLTVMPLLSYVFKVRDVIMGLSTVFLGSASHLIIALSTTATGLYIASIVQVGFTGSYVICRSMMSKCVDPGEQGKLNAIFGLLGAIIPMVSGLVYTELFHATIITFPAACFLLSTIITILPAGVFTWMILDMRKTNPNTSNDDVELLEHSAESEQPQPDTLVEYDHGHLDKYDPQNEPWQRNSK